MNRQGGIALTIVITAIIRRIRTRCRVTTRRRDAERRRRKKKRNADKSRKNLALMLIPSTDGSGLLIVGFAELN